MVTAERVWEALAEVSDPEIPTLSVVDLGVVKRVDVEGARVRIEFTPTFLGCPALEVMRDEMAARIRELGGEPEVEVVLDDSWSTDRITPAGRRKLRESGFAPPAPRGSDGPQLVELRSARAGHARPLHGAGGAGHGSPGVFRCPYCGSTDTRLENLFGPTPCRSIRYCASCRQPFEQFKTI
jgi:ring-1,2-phenylacetyl-CoA epoxidase subunit PaaD